MNDLLAIIAGFSAIIKPLPRDIILEMMADQIRVDRVIDQMREMRGMNDI
jgi:hypothetical protein